MKVGDGRVAINVVGLRLVGLEATSPAVVVRMISVSAGVPERTLIRRWWAPTCAGAPGN